MMSLSFMMRSSAPSILTSVPDHLPNRTRSPFFKSMATILPSSPRAPGPTAMTSPYCGFSAAVSGMMMPPEVLVSLSTRRRATRSWRGRNFMVLCSNVIGRPSLKRAGPAAVVSGSMACRGYGVLKSPPIFEIATWLPPRSGRPHHDGRSVA